MTLNRHGNNRTTTKTNRANAEKNTKAHCLSVSVILNGSFSLGSKEFESATVSEIFRGENVLTDAIGEKLPLIGTGASSVAEVSRSAHTRKRISVDAGSESYSNFVFGP